MDHTESANLFDVFSAINQDKGKWGRMMLVYDTQKGTNLTLNYMDKGNE